MQLIHKSFIAILLLIGACSFEEILSPEQQLEADIAKIKEYLIRENLIDKAVETSSGLHYYIEESGSDTIFPDLTSALYLRYRGRFLDGTSFDVTSSISNCIGIEDSCSVLKVNRTVSGFREGVTFFNAGSKGSLYIPSGLGYGTTGTSNIPGNSVLIFDLDILDVID